MVTTMEHSTEQMNQVIKFIPSENTIGSSFRIHTNAFINDVHATITMYLMKQKHIKYQYSTVEQLYRVVGYKDGLVDERFHIQICCVATAPTDLFIYTNPTLFIVFNTEILGSSAISKQYEIYKDLKMIFVSEYGKQPIFSKM
jgi:hypothetical protein